MNFYAAFNDAIVEHASRVWPVLSCQPSLQILLVLAVNLVLLMAALGALVAMSRLAKSPEGRILVLGILGALLVDVVLFLCGISPKSVRDFSWLALFLVLNSMPIGLAMLLKFLGKKGTTLTINYRTDLGLTTITGKGKKLLKCPGCGAETISSLNAMHVPQTCGECKRKYQMQKSMLLQYGALSFLIVSMFAIFYLVLEGKTSRDNGLLEFFGVAIFHSVLMMRSVKLVEVAD